MKYQIDGFVVNTEKATAYYTDTHFFDGSNQISYATRSQWENETLYRSRKGRYYIVHESQWQGSADRAWWVSQKEAAAWLLTNQYEEIPEDLKDAAEEVEE